MLPKYHASQSHTLWTHSVHALQVELQKVTADKDALALRQQPLVATVEDLQTQVREADFKQQQHEAELVKRDSAALETAASHAEAMKVLQTTHEVSGNNSRLALKWAQNGFCCGEDVSCDTSHDFRCIATLQMDIANGKILSTCKLASGLLMRCSLRLNLQHTNGCQIGICSTG